MASAEVGGGLAGEIQRLRDWRHDVVSPELGALGARLALLERTYADLAPKVERMARADEIADAVATRMKANRRSMLTAWEKAGGAILSALLIADMVRSWVLG